MTIKFIFLTPDHLSVCASLYVEVFASSPWNEAWTLSSAERRLRQTYGTPEFIGIGYFEEDCLLGFALGYCEDWLDNKIFYLKEMCVQSKLQGKGLGKIVLQRLKEHLKTLQVEKMYLLTMLDSPAQQFYLKQHFTVSERWVVMGCLF